MKRSLALIAILAVMLSAAPVFAKPGMGPKKPVGTQNAMMQGKGKKVDLKKQAMKKVMKKAMKKPMKKMMKQGMKDMPAPTPSTDPAVTPSADPSTTPSATPTAQTYQVKIENFAFGTPSLTVKIGDTITWTNMDTTAHTVESDDSTTFKSSSLAKDATFSFTFTTAGTFNYHCGPHAQMTGTVVVH